MNNRYKFKFKKDTWYQAEYFGQKLPYDITIDGRFKSRYQTRKNKELGLHLNAWGYYTVRMSIDKRPLHRFLHTILAHTFLTLPEGYNYKDLTINHIDGNKLNNSLDNLEWCTFGQNQIHKFDYNLQKSTRGPVDHNFYLFRHEDGREFTGTSRQLFHKFKDQDNLFQQGIRNMIKGYNSSNGYSVTQHKGWRKLQTVEKPDEETLAKLALYTPVPKPSKTY